MQATDLGQRIGRQGDVDAVADQALLELARGQLAGAGLERALERLAGLVGRLADRAALLGRELGHPAQEVGQLGLAAQVAHARLLQRLACSSPRSTAAWASRSISAIRSIMPGPS